MAPFLPYSCTIFGWKFLKKLKNLQFQEKWGLFLFCDSMDRMTGFFKGYEHNEHILNWVEHTIPFIYINGAIFHRTVLIFSCFFCLKLSNHTEKMAPFRLYWFKSQLNMLGGKTHVSATFADIFSGLNLVNGLMAPFFRCTFVLKNSIF